MLRATLIGLLVFGFCAPLCAQTQAQIDIQQATENAKMETNHKAQTAVTGKVCASDEKSNAQNLRGQCVAAGATAQQLSPGDTFISDGDFQMALGQNDWDAAVTLEGGAEVHRIECNIMWGNGNFDDACDPLSGYPIVTIRFGNAGKRYDDATDNYGDAYWEYYDASGYFEALLGNLGGGGMNP